MKSQSQIDATLRLIGSAPPPSGLDRRINASLDAPSGRFPGRLLTIHSVSAIAIAASLTIATLALSPSLRELALRGHAGYPVAPRAMTHPQRAFGGASAVHVPTTPVPVQPTPVSQGRGHARSGRSILQGRPARAPLPRGVALRASPRIAARPVSPAVSTSSGLR